MTKQMSKLPRTPALLTCAIGLWLAGSAATTLAQPVVVPTYNTGVDVNQIVLADAVADPHYTLLSVPSGPLSAPVAKTVGAPLYPLGGWAAVSSTSAWIVPTAPLDITPPSDQPSLPGSYASSIGPVGTYVYRTTFDLSGYDLAAPVLLNGLWAADNTGLSIRLNSAGNPGSQGDLITAGFGNYNAVASFGFTDANFLLQTFTANSGFQPGLNTLDFVLHNEGGPTGLRVEYALEATPVPEPAAWALMASGALALGLLRRRRQ